MYKIASMPSEFVFLGHSFLIRNDMKSKKPHSLLLSLLTSIFAFRVVSQFALQYREMSFLPKFDLWHSATLTYSTLLAIQCILFLMMVAGILFSLNAQPRPKSAKTLIVLGWLYTAAMAVRLVVGVSGASTNSWFDGAIPTAFHFGLAAYILVLGASLKDTSPGSRVQACPAVVRYFAYPTLLIGAYLLFIWLTNTGSPLLFSAYLSVLVAAFGILFHEIFAPNREEWRPSPQEVFSDGLFLTIVQIALPAALKGLALVAIVWLSGNNKAPLIAFWPSELPTLVQVAIMFFVAEFFRYWMHRMFHKNRVLWKLHAVHHAADKLYSVNVGRFHPLDKALQFLGDTLPFLLLGVPSEVFAAYFVLYAVNGFYQHSNSDVRLGFLNWIIAGPELHRWHHSVKISEAHSNYGNNLILWDTIFGTRFLPKGEQVDRVGIGNEKWPDGFLKQMSAPFNTPTEAPPKQ